MTHTHTPRRTPLTHGYVYTSANQQMHLHARMLVSSVYVMMDLTYVSQRLALLEPAPCHSVYTQKAVLVGIIKRVFLYTRHACYGMRHPVLWAMYK